MEWIKGWFSGGVSLSRVHPEGIVLMALAIGLVIAAKPISKRCSEARREGVFMGVKVAGLLLCCLGAAVAMR